MFVGYVYGESMTGQAAHYQLGLMGIMITNMNNNCSMGSSVLVHAVAIIGVSNVRCALALGFERMVPGTIGINTTFPNCPNPLCLLLATMEHTLPDLKWGPLMPRIFGATVVEYFKKYSGRVDHLVKIGEFCVQCMLYSRK